MLRCNFFNCIIFARKAKMVNTAFTQWSHTIANVKKSCTFATTFLLQQRRVKLLNLLCEMMDLSYMCSKYYLWTALIVLARKSNFVFAPQLQVDVEYCLYSIFTLTANTKQKKCFLRFDDLCTKSKLHVCRYLHSVANAKKIQLYCGSKY